MPKFRRIPKNADCIRITRDMVVYTERGQVAALPGEWMVNNIGDEQYPISHELFLQLYEPVDEEAEDYLHRVKKWRFVEDENGIISKQEE